MQRKLSLTWLIFIQIALLSRRETQAANSCVNMWDADPNDQSLTICDGTQIEKPTVLII